MPVIFAFLILTKLNTIKNKLQIILNLKKVRSWENFELKTKRSTYNEPFEMWRISHTENLEDVLLDFEVKFHLRYKIKVTD